MLDQYVYTPYIVQSGEILEFNTERHEKQVFELLLICR